ncbi:M48 family metallopeptidase [Planctomycetota bacterium]
MPIRIRPYHYFHISKRNHEILRPAIKIRSMQRSWGSCNDPVHILLNTRLIKAPLCCVDYVIVHELCHIKYPPHSQDF